MLKCFVEKHLKSVEVKPDEILENERAINGKENKRMDEIKYSNWDPILVDSDWDTVIMLFLRVHDELDQVAGIFVVALIFRTSPPPRRALTHDFDSVIFGWLHVL